MSLFQRKKRTTARKRRKPEVPARVRAARARAWRRRFRGLLGHSESNRRVDERARKRGRAKMAAFAQRVRGLTQRGAAYVLVAVLAAALPAGLFIGYRWVLDAPHFLVREVVLEGNTKIAGDALVAAAGLDRPVNTLTLDDGELAAAVGSLPWIRSAQVEVVLPQTVKIVVKERRAAALVALGALYMVDERGALFRAVRTADDSDLPILTGFRRSDFTDPGRQAESRRRLLDALAVIRAWDSANLDGLAELSELECDRVFGHIVRTAGNHAELWLGRGDYDEKLTRLADILLDLRLRGRVPQKVFLDSPDAPGRVTVRSRKVGAGAPGAVAVSPNRAR